MSFHMGSLGFLTPFQFYASDGTDTKFSTDSENGTSVQAASKVPVYRAAVEKVMRGKGTNSIIVLDTIRAPPAIIIVAIPLRYKLSGCNDNVATLQRCKIM